MPSAAFAAIITRDHLAYAKVLADRLRRFHDEPVYVLCVDALPEQVDQSSLPFRVVTLDEVLPGDQRAMTFFYTAFEFCNALKPWLLRWLLAHTPHDRWIYLDADVVPYGSFGEALAELEFASLLLTPHALTPPALAHAASLETMNLVYGVYNGGFLAIRRCAEAERFVAWQAERLATLGFRGWKDVFVDQLWLNLVPVYFEGVKDWRHPGANVANWNLYERTLGRAGSEFTANGKPLIFAHLSHWRFDAPEHWTLGRPVSPDTDPAILAEIGRSYRDALAASGRDECATWGYGFGSFADGRWITPPMRRDWYERIQSGTAPGGSPFDHPEWFRGPRYVEWRRYVPLSVKRFLHRSITER
jgi:hypothetical protein